MSFKPYTEKIKKKKIGICSRTGPGSGSIIPEADPHQNDTDPKHRLSVSDIFFPREVFFYKIVTREVRSGYRHFL